jgi:hypothetical protein
LQLVKTDAGTWKAIICKQGWPITSKTFRTKRYAMDWRAAPKMRWYGGVHLAVQAPSA